jgi:hypothetical protein
VSRELKAGRLWDVWIRHGLLTQDRGRGQSPLHVWAHPQPRAVVRQRRVDVLSADLGSPCAQRALTRREGRLRDTEVALTDSPPAPF